MQRFSSLWDDWESLLDFHSNRITLWTTLWTYHMRFVWFCTVFIFLEFFYWSTFEKLLRFWWIRTKHCVPYWHANDIAANGKIGYWQLLLRVYWKMYTSPTILLSRGWNCYCCNSMWGWCLHYSWKYNYIL